MKKKFIIPLVVFIILAGFLAVGLFLDPKRVPSPYIGKTAPAFKLPVLLEASQTFSPTDLNGEVWLLNVWATWCVSCRQEHPVLVDFSRQQPYKMVGLNYKDNVPGAKQWLQDLGNPYYINAVDKSGRVAIDWGVYGAPETFVIDKKGIVRYKHIGPLSYKDLDEIVLPLLQELQRENS